MTDEVLNEVNAFRTLEQVINWAFARTPAAKLIDVIAQDEFTNDVVIVVDEETYLSFDTT
jgi:hypothetical protein